jgi:hypothetical protein
MLLKQVFLLQARRILPVIIILLLAVVHWAENIYRVALVLLL